MGGTTMPRDAVAPAPVFVAVPWLQPVMTAAAESSTRMYDVSLFI